VWRSICALFLRTDSAIEAWQALGANGATERPPERAAGADIDLKLRLDGINRVAGQSRHDAGRCTSEHGCYKRVLLISLGLHVHPLAGNLFSRYIPRPTRFNAILFSDLCWHLQWMPAAFQCFNSTEII
jgi:hypothetical protein